MVSVRIDHCIETLCQKGCKALWADIAALEKGAIPVEAEALNSSERDLVLEELKSIMSVYTKSCKTADAE